MIEYQVHLEEYKSEAFLAGSRMKEEEWGNEAAAAAYLEEYWLTKEEYERRWRPIQDTIFQQRKTLPEMMFQEDLALAIIRGGVIMEEGDMGMFQECMQDTGDQEWIIVENLFDRDGSHDWPPFYMKYPRDITFGELMSGNCISAVLLEWPWREYFMFGDSGQWGMYVASDYIHPINIIGCRKEHEELFRKVFAVSDEEVLEIAEWVPESYKKYLRLPPGTPGPSDVVGGPDAGTSQGIYERIKDALRRL